MGLLNAYYIIIVFIVLIPRLSTHPVSALWFVQVSTITCWNLIGAEGALMSRLLPQHRKLGSPTSTCPSSTYLFPSTLI